MKLGPRHNSEYDRQCPYEWGPDYKGRMVRCQNAAGRCSGNHDLVPSWVGFQNPYEDIWRER